MYEYPTDDEPDKKLDEKFLDLEADGANQRQKSLESGGVLTNAKQGSSGYRGAVEKDDEFLTDTHQPSLKAEDKEASVNQPISIPDVN